MQAPVAGPRPAPAGPADHHRFIAKSAVACTAGHRGLVLRVAIGTRLSMAGIRAKPMRNANEFANDTAIARANAADEVAYAADLCGTRGRTASELAELEEQSEQCSL